MRLYRLLKRFIKLLKFPAVLEELSLIIRTGRVDLSQFYTFFVEEVVDKFPKAKKFLKKLIFFKIF